MLQKLDPDELLLLIMAIVMCGLCWAWKVSVVLVVRRYRAVTGMYYGQLRPGLEKLPLCLLLF